MCSSDLVGNLEQVRQDVVPVEPHERVEIDGEAHDPARRGQGGEGRSHAAIGQEGPDQCRDHRQMVCKGSQ